MRRTIRNHFNEAKWGPAWLEWTQIYTICTAHVSIIQKQTIWDIWTQCTRYIRLPDWWTLKSSVVIFCKFLSRHVSFQDKCWKKKSSNVKKLLTVLQKKKRNRKCCPNTSGEVFRLRTTGSQCNYTLVPYILVSVFNILHTVYVNTHSAVYVNTLCIVYMWMRKRKWHPANCGGDTTETGVKTFQFLFSDLHLFAWLICASTLKVLTNDMIISQPFF